MVSMKLKLNTAGAAGSPPPSQSAATPTPTTGSLKLKIRPPGAAGSPPPATPASATPKLKLPKATAASKKRQRDDDAGQDGSSAKKPATGTIRLSQNKFVGRSATISLKGRTGSISTPTTTRLKIKTKGKIPPRPLGVGYDSDAEDAEDDPAMEEHFILRMTPGEDCDYLRKAIEERKIGVPKKEGGAEVSMRFWRGDGRRASINIRGNLYAAVLVDLPCIVETMKSWDKRGWWKSADICQMLMVYKRIAKLEDGQDCSLPPEVDEKTWQWPHGLTPPMYNVRRRRFRKRVSHRTIEAAEQEVERLLAADKKCKDNRGTSTFEVVDLDQMREEEEEEEDAEFDDEADAEGEPDEDMAADPAFLESIMAGLEEDEDMVAEVPATASEIAAAADIPTPTVEAEVLAVAEEATSPEVDATGVTEAEDEDESEEEEDDEDGEDEEEDDEEAKERAQEMAQQRDEIAYLETEITMQREAYAKQANPLLKRRLLDKIKSLEADVQIKKRSLGVTDDDA